MARLLLHVVNDAGVFLSHRRVFAQAAREAGWTVHVATPPCPAVDQIVTAGFVHHPIPLSRRGMNPVAEMRALRGLARLFTELRPDVVDCATIKPVLYGGIAATYAGVPGLVQSVMGLGHVFAARGPAASLRRLLVRGAYLAACRHGNSRVVCQNPEDRARLAFALRPGQSAVVPGSGVDPDRFRPAPEPGGTPVVLLAGRMLWTKGIGEFVEAASALRARGVRARFVLVGEPDANNPAPVPVDALSRWNRAGQVEWWGRRNDMPRVLRDVAVVCLPTYYGEGVPKVLVEAAASGRAIVATDWPGCREIVRDGWNGLLVSPRDSSALADALDRLIADGRLRRQMGERGRSLALGRFTEAHVVRAVLHLYDELAATVGSADSLPRTA